MRGWLVWRAYLLLTVLAFNFTPQKISFRCLWSELIYVNWIGNASMWKHSSFLRKYTVYTPIWNIWYYIACVGLHFLTVECDSRSSGLWCHVVLGYDTNSSVQPWSSTLLVSYCITGWCHNPDNFDLNLHCHENLTSCIQCELLRWAACTLTILYLHFQKIIDNPSPLSVLWTPRRRNSCWRPEYQ
jgi:hypothetical protein